MSRDQRTYFLTSSNMSPWNSVTIPKPGPKVAPDGFKLPPMLEKGQRGGVVSDPMTVIGTGAQAGVRQEKEIDPGLLRTALLFVDKLDCPTIQHIEMNDPTMGQLMDASLLTRSNVRFEGSPGVHEQHKDAPWLAYKALDKREPGMWSIWQEPGQKLVPEREMSPALAFQLEFNSGLIIPHPELPFDDVIVFKERHRDELLSLHHHLLKLAIKISQETDPRAVTIELEAFDTSLADYLKKARQSNIRRAVASLTAEMDWAAAVRDSLLGGGGAGLLSAAGGLSIGAAATAIGGGVLTALSIKSTAGLKKPEASPFRYIARVEREFGE